MTIILDIIIAFCVIMCLGLVICLGISYLIKVYYIRHPIQVTRNINTTFPQLLLAFDTANSGSELGKQFTQLIKSGFFQNLRAVNHGNAFPDERQYQGFLRYATPDVTKALKEVGDSFETFII